MENNIKVFSKDFVKKMGAIVRETREDEAIKGNLTDDEVKAVITKTFYLLGMNHKRFEEKAGI